MHSLKKIRKIHYHLKRYKKRYWFSTFILYLVMFSIFIFSQKPIYADAPFNYTTFNPGNKTCNDIGSNCLEINSSGFYDGSNGKDYLLLSGDIHSNRSGLFLGSDIRTLDLNGYTLYFADENYTELNNGNFSMWTNGFPDNWDVSLASNLRNFSTSTEMPLPGDYGVYMEAGESIISDLIYLPVVDRRYRALISERGTGSWGAPTRIEVYDSDGQLVCNHTSGGGMGGGTAFCDFMINATGNYKMKVTPTIRDVYYSNAQIVPAHDIGIGMIRWYNEGQCENWGSGGCYGADYVNDSLPGVGAVNITIKNGMVKSLHSATGVYGIGVQDIVGESQIEIDNVLVDVNGIDAKTLWVAIQGEIHNSEFRTNQKWVYDRQDLGEVSAILGQSMYIHDNAFIGGQGNIYLDSYNRIENNYFENNEKVTNHYSIIQYSSGTVGYNNISGNTFSGNGSGIMLSTGTKYNLIYNNSFGTLDNPMISQTCDAEYSNAEYTTNAIRITDYDRSNGTINGGNYGNEIYNNTFYLKGVFYDNFPNCQTIANGIFYSVGAGNNYIYDNNFYVNNTDNRSMAYAFYIGSSGNGGVWENNHVYYNDAAAWLSSYYGPASNSIFEANTFQRINNSYFSGTRCGVLWNVCCEDSATFRIGACCNWDVANISLINNFFIDISNTQKMCFHDNLAGSYNFDYYWYLDLLIDDGNNSINGAQINLRSNSSIDNDGYSDSNGSLRLTIEDFTQYGDISPFSSSNVSENPYTLMIRKYGYRGILDLINVTSQMNYSVSLQSETAQCLSNDTDMDSFGFNCSLGLDCNESDIAVNPFAIEICNGLDDDCSSSTNETIMFGTTTCGLGICEHTINNCDFGSIQTCNPLEGAESEIRGDGIDQDCDGYDSLNYSSLVLLNSPNDQNITDYNNITFVCNVSDTTGIRKIDFYINSSGTFDLESTYIPDQFMWIEAEDFNLTSDWQICGNGNSCQSDYSLIEDGASGLSHVVAKEANSGLYPLEKVQYLSEGSYKLWARSYSRGGLERSWRLVVDGVNSSQTFADEGNLGWIWEEGGQFNISSTGNHTLEIVDTSADYYWTYPDLILLTKDLTYNPSNDCGDNVSLFKRDNPYSEIYSRYDNYNCNKTINNSTISFHKLLGLGEYDWKCSVIDTLGFENSTTSRHIIVTSELPVCGNNIKEAGETCDDGDTISGDGCSATCITEQVSLSSGGGGGGGGASIANTGVVKANSSDLPKGTNSGKNSVIGKVFPQVDNKETKISGFEYTLWFYVFVVVILLSIGVIIFIGLLKVLV